MASLQNIQSETMATIDTAKALADKVLAILTIMIDEPSLALNFSTNPIGFLFQILKSIGVKPFAFGYLRLFVYLAPGMALNGLS